MEIRFTPEYEMWFSGLTGVQKRQVVIYVDRLGTLGHMVRMPVSRPVGDGLFELRPTADGVELRVFYVYDNGALLLIGGIKSGTTDERFFYEHKPKALEIYARFKATQGVKKESRLARGSRNKKRPGR